MDATYNNAAYQPNTPDDFSRPPPYSPQSPSPPPETTGYYPQQYPQQPPIMYPPPQSPPPPGFYPPQSPPPPGFYPPQSPPPPGFYPPQYPQQAPVMNVPPGQQQQTTTVVVAAPPQQAPHVSYCGMIVLACLVFWICNQIFGLIAFILAVVAENTKTSDAKGAQKLGKASMLLSICGIILSVFIVAIVVGLTVPTAKPRDSGSRQVTTKYISPNYCCSSNGYYYPGYGNYCYYSTTTSYRYTLVSICCGYGDSYYYSSSTYGYCY